MTGARDPREGVETPTVRIGGRPGEYRLAILGVVGAAVAIVAVGLGLGTPPEASESSFDPSVAAVGSPPSAATTSTSPTEEVCTRPTVDAPRFALWSTSNDRDPLPGVAATSPAPDRSGAPWPVPGLAGAILQPEGESLVVVADDNLCIARIRLVVAPSDAEVPGADPTSIAPEVDAPDDRVTIGTLDVGDWILRITVTFSRSDVVGEVSATRYFRVVAGPITELAPSPQVTPAVACAAQDAAGAPPALDLVIGDGAPLPAPVLPEGLPGPIAVQLGEPIEIRARGDRCARGWTINVSDELGNSLLQESYPNPVDNPFTAAQNRWLVNQVFIGQSVVTATVRFGREVGPSQQTVTGTWTLDIAPPPLPEVLALSDQATVARVLPGCGQFWTLPDVAAFQPCEFQSVPDGLATLAITSGERIRLEVGDDWQVGDWFARCGETRAGESGQVFVTTDACDLGERQGGPIVVVPWPGDRVLFFGLAFERDGVTAYGNYLVRVVVGN